MPVTALAGARAAEPIGASCTQTVRAQDVRTASAQVMAAPPAAATGRGSALERQRADAAGRSIGSPGAGSCDTTNPSPDIRATARPSRACASRRARSARARRARCRPARPTSTLTTGDSCGSDRRTRRLPVVVARDQHRRRRIDRRRHTEIAQRRLGDPPEDRRRTRGRRSGRSGRAASRASRESRPSDRATARSRQTTRTCSFE